MKKTQEVIGLPIINISDGMETGKVKDIIINAETGSVDYVAVDNGNQLLSTNVIAADNIVGIGEYAMTIENENVICETNSVPAALDLLKKNVRVKGTRVLTKKGRLIGEIGDIFIDEDSRIITALEFIADVSQKTIRLIPRESVITFGKNLLVVVEEVEATLVDTIAQLKPEYTAYGDEKKNLTNPESYEKSSTIPEAEDNKLNHNPEKPPVEQGGNEASTPQDSDIGQISADMEPDLAANGTGAAALFEQRQKQYLKGRLTTKTIVDASGAVIIEEGTVITEEIIEMAKINGKLIELVMNNKA